MKKRKEEIKERREKEKRGKREKEEGWRDRSAIRKNDERVAAKTQGVGTENCQGISRVLRLGGLWAGWATLSHFLKTFLFCKTILAIKF